MIHALKRSSIGLLLMVLVVSSQSIVCAEWNWDNLTPSDAKNAAAASPPHHCHNRSATSNRTCPPVTGRVQSGDAKRTGSSCGSTCGQGLFNSDQDVVATTASYGDHGPRELSELSSNTGSVIYNFGSNYMHWGDDIRANESGVTIRRFHRPRFIAIPSSIEPGVFSNLDIRLTAEGGSYGSYGDLYEFSFLVQDPTAPIPYFMHNEDAEGFVMKPSLEGVAQELRIGPGGQPENVRPLNPQEDVSLSNFYRAFNQNDTAELVCYDGTVMTFDVLRIPDRETWDQVLPPPDDPYGDREYPQYTEARYGSYGGYFSEKLICRLTSVSGRGLSYNITYKTPTLDAVSYTHLTLPTIYSV